MIRKVEIYLFAGGITGLITGPMVKTAAFFVKRFWFTDLHSPVTPLVTQITRVVNSTFSFAGIVASLVLAIIFFAFEPHIHKSTRHVIAATMWGLSALYFTLFYLIRFNDGQVDKQMVLSTGMVSNAVIGLLFVVVLDVLKKRMLGNSLSDSTKEDHTGNMELHGEVRPADDNKRNTEREFTRALLVALQLLGMFFIAIWAWSLVFTMYGLGPSTWTSLLVYLSFPLWLLIPFVISWVKYKNNNYSAARSISTAPIGIIIITVVLYKLAREILR